MQLDHRSILVRDLADSLKFYQSILGMEVLRTSGSPMTGVWVGADGKDLLHLNVGPADRLAHVKDVHIALRTDRFDEFIAKLTTSVTPFESWRGDPNTVGRHALGFRQVCLQDPDGYWIEVNDVDPARKLAPLR